MKVAVCFKVVPDDQDILVAADGSLDFSKAKNAVSSYDLNAIELASQLAEGDAVLAVTAGGKGVDDSKLKKNVLARGASELYMVADEACAELDAYQTAGVLADQINGIGDVDLVLCGDGSADNFAQQVDVQLACALGWPVVTAASAVEVADGSLRVSRALEDELETVEVELPAVVSVLPEVATPRIPGMKDILAAGKKPMNVTVAETVAPGSIEIVECKAPESADRELIVAEASADGAIARFAEALKAAL